MITLAIIEDESRTRSFLKGLLESMEIGVTIVGEANSVDTGHELIVSKGPDVVLMDVELGDGTGFDILSRLSPPVPQLIFITAFDHYAIRAFKTNAVDYILKPVDPDELRRAVAEAAKRVKQKTEPNYMDVLKQLLSEQSDRIAVPSGFGLTYVQASEILYVAADGAYSQLHFEGNRKRLIVSKTLKDVQQSLERFGFIRIHRSCLINGTKIRELNRSDGGYVVLSTGKRISFSKQYRNEAISTILAMSGSI